MRHLLFVLLILPSMGRAQSSDACSRRQDSYNKFKNSVQSGGQQLYTTDPTCYQQIADIVQVKDESKKCFNYALASSASASAQGAVGGAVGQANNLTVMAQLYDQNKNNCDMYGNWIQYKCKNQYNSVVQSAKTALNDYSQCAGDLRNKAAGDSGQARTTIASAQGEVQVAGLLHACYLAVCLISNSASVHGGIQTLDMTPAITVEDASEEKKSAYVAP